jgi:hypothetical protein
MASARLRAASTQYQAVDEQEHARRLRSVRWLLIRACIVSAAA